MPQQSERDRIIEALQDLPPEASLDDAIERLIFLAKIEAGLAELDAGEGIPHDQAEQRLHL
jgi:predicted transcriptional regulator